MKRIISIVFLGLVLLLSGCESESENTLVVGLECNYAPFNWTTSNDSNEAVYLFHDKKETLRL